MLEVTHNILRYREIQDWQLHFCAILFQSIISKELSLPARNILDKVIEGYGSGLQNFNIYYSQLFCIPILEFDALNLRKHEIISNWKTFDRNLIFNILLSNLDSPENISKVCLEILKNWKSEINIQIEFGFNKTYTSEHLIIALGHPNLEGEVKNIANEIHKLHINNELKISDSISSIIKQIVIHNKYPNWSTEYYLKYIYKISCKIIYINMYL